VARSKVLRQREWTEAELAAAGFDYYQPVKRLVMARMITEETNIELSLEILTASSGDIIVYAPGDTVKPELDDYDHWPVKRDVFRQVYKRWDDSQWKPNEAQRHLLGNGCLPFYRARGVWALKLPISIYVQSLESPQPVVVPAGRWLCIGAEGEPYNMSDADFYERYVIPAQV